MRKFGRALVTVLAFIAAVSAVVLVYMLAEFGSWYYCGEFGYITFETAMKALPPAASLMLFWFLIHDACRKP